MDVEEGFLLRSGVTCCAHLLADGSTRFLEDVGPSVEEVFVTVVPSGTARAEDRVIVREELAAVLLARGFCSNLAAR